MVPLGFVNFVPSDLNVPGNESKQAWHAMMVMVNHWVVSKPTSVYLPIPTFDWFTTNTNSTTAAATINNNCMYGIFFEKSAVNKVMVTSVKPTFAFHPTRNLVLNNTTRLVVELEFQSHGWWLMAVLIMVVGQDHLDSRSSKNFIINGLNALAHSRKCWQKWFELKLRGDSWPLFFILFPGLWMSTFQGSKPFAIAGNGKVSFREKQQLWLISRWIGPDRLEDTHKHSTQH